MTALEPRCRLVVATKHEGTRRKEVDVRRVERSLLLDGCKRLVCLEPRPRRVGLTASLELVDSNLRAAAHIPSNVNAGRPECDRRPRKFCAAWFSDYPMGM